MSALQQLAAAVGEARANAAQPCLCEDPDACERCRVVGPRAVQTASRVALATAERALLDALLSAHAVEVIEAVRALGVARESGGLGSIEVDEAFDAVCDIADRLAETGGE